MKGERLQWFILASHLHLSLQRCQMETTSLEFTDWMYYLERDVNAFHREDYFFARISMQIANIFSKSPQKLKDFLIKFKPEKEAEITPEQKEMSLKKKFLIWAGIKPKD